MQSSVLTLSAIPRQFVGKLLMHNKLDIFLYICFFVQRVERVKSNLAHFIVFRVILNYIVGIGPRSFRKFLLL